MRTKFFRIVAASLPGKPCLEASMNISEAILARGRLICSDSKDPKSRTFADQTKCIRVGGEQSRKACVVRWKIVGEFPVCDNHEIDLMLRDAFHQQLRVGAWRKPDNFLSE
mgnify:CR=1 FL=1